MFLSFLFVLFYENRKKFMKKIQKHSIGNLKNSSRFDFAEDIAKNEPISKCKVNSSTKGSLGRDSDAPWSICLSHFAAWYLLEAD
ncbi:hypothetical protein V6N13_142285 [Hibiscus sabdariffa]|uniref:Uncharacterized protein n=1 Tax=Hibiscus sabdariffa TaxID=183260 RepID=A0ABR2FDP0_9ROSI